MGFGILFIGYAITFGSAFISTYFFGDIIGCIIMTVALGLLSQYCRMFRYTAISAGGLCAVYAASAVMRMMGYGTPSETETFLIGEQIYQWIQYILPVVTLVFYCLLIMSVAKIAKDVELLDLVKRCGVYLGIFAAYAVAFALFFFFSERVAETSVRAYNVIASGLSLFQAIWMLMMFALILSCLKWIAPEEQIEAENRGEDYNEGVLAKIGGVLDDLQEKAYTPKDEKDEQKLLREFNKSSHSSKSKTDESNENEKK